jgi:hypothetical protein
VSCVASALASMCPGATVGGSVPFAEQRERERSAQQVLTTGAGGACGGAAAD